MNKCSVLVEALFFLYVYMNNVLMKDFDMD
jgi:hypothetical protein